MKEKDNNKKLKIALIHDFLLYPGGAEKILETLMEMFPDAPIYTLLYDENTIGEKFKNKDIRTSFLDSWPKICKKNHRYLLPFFGPAIESMDFREFDLVISSSGAWSKGIITRLNTSHIAYIHSPMRYVWDENERYMKRIIPKRNFFVRQFLSYLRVWDYQAAQRPDVLISNSKYTQERISKYYRRESEVVYPLVDTDKNIKKISKKQFSDKKKGSFLIISRLSKYKNVALAIEVCNKLQLQLTVVGQGPEYDYLKKLAGKTVQIKGWVSEEEKWELLNQARALIFPCEDDFGIVCIEALSTGTPVIALGRGGAKEIIRPDLDGILFDVPTLEVAADGFRRFIMQEDKFKSKELIKRSEKFSKNEFKKKIHKIIENTIKK